MVEPFGLGVLGAVAATEGIKFLYGQAAEVLKRWRERRSGHDPEAHAPIPVDPAAARLLEGELVAPTVDFDALQSRHDEIRQLAGTLGNYAGGIEVPEAGDRGLADAVDRLRRALEEVYGQRITFKGEDREPSGVRLRGVAEAGTVDADAANVGVDVDGRLQPGDSAEGFARATTVKGQQAGVRYKPGQ
jgi:hypothetical protein